jgi:hypothetical protein
MKASQKMRYASTRQIKKQHQVQRNLQNPDSTKRLILWIIKIIHHFLPSLFRHLRQVEDLRKQSDYKLAEILFAGIAVFLFKRGSRNAMNLERRKLGFVRNFKKVFGFRHTHTHRDAVDSVMRKLPIEIMEHD